MIFRRQNTSLEIGLKPFSGLAVSILTLIFNFNPGYGLHLDKNMIFTKITILTRKIFEIQKFFFPSKPPWTKLFWLPTWCWSHENYPFQAKIGDEKIQISEKCKFQKSALAQPQVIFDPNPCTSGPHGGWPYWWAPCHCSTFRTTFSPLHSGRSQ